MEEFDAGDSVVDSSQTMSRIQLILVGIFALFLISAGATILAVSGPTDPPPQTSQDGASSDPSTGLSARLRDAVTAGGVMEHQRRFAAIAEENGGNRAAGTPGYDASAGYVAETLREAGYEVSTQQFALPESARTAEAELERTSPNPETYGRGEDFSLMESSGGGEVSAPVQPVDFARPDAGGSDSTSGCEPEDFEGFGEGSVALLRRGTCTFEAKVENAEAAGAAAVLVSNAGTGGDTGTFSGSLGDSGLEIPALATGSGLGEDLARDDGPEVRLLVEPDAGTNTTRNVIAASPGGDEENTVVVGAHLDSIPNGPGMNDNASGSATILEVAQEMARLEEQPRNKIRFVFWGGEELGLLGSDYYVNELEEDSLNDIAVYLNFDMVASPNYVRFLYGSPEVTRVFEEYFESRDLETDSFDLAGRSDHGPFAAEDVPVGGIFSGDSSIKTRQQARQQGGEAGEPYDACYHRSCDDLDNLNREALREISDAAAHATATFARREY